MGVYHLMGLGLSPGVVTGPISYLAKLYNNWEVEGKEFFARSGEEKQREKGDQVGGIQLLILFTTKEVINGEVDCKPYIKNPYGKIGGNPEKRTDTMKKILEPLLIQEWSKIKSSQNNTGIIYWCEVELSDIKTTYERIAKVVASLAKGGGKQGKEIWMNLTGGNNVINSALQMVASLSHEVSRLYYVQSANEKAEKCVYFTSEKREEYWVELPVIPLVLSDLNNAVLEIPNLELGISSKEVYGRLKGHERYSILIEGIDFEQFRDTTLRSMNKLGLITVRKEYETGNGICTLGPQWELILKYESIMNEAKAGEEVLTIEKLEQQKTWINRQEIRLN
ncbi:MULTISPECIES: hypothetical protein [Nostocales]|uniref:CRISPR-associated protein n=3 Tax=Nostocales TaxID=1161 RepID=A0A0C1NBF8_9CYAN|nr:hypothetical protein [Tolypothrix bouteillei]KAF3890570.1 hypothetical protein DA73_0400037790 [Tolypothrix bouteillei VB521301]